MLDMELRADSVERLADGCPACVLIRFTRPIDIRDPVFEACSTLVSSLTHGHELRLKPRNVPGGRCVQLGTSNETSETLAQFLDSTTERVRELVDATVEFVRRSAQAGSGIVGDRVGSIRELGDAMTELIG